MQLNKPKAAEFFEIDLDLNKNSIWDKFYYEDVKDRNLMLNADIDETAIELINAHIRRFNSQDRNIPVEDRKPIKIFINSYGGSVYDGFGAVGAIVTSKTPVYTYVEGHCMSMGFAIFMAGHKRFALPYSTFMYHEVSTGVRGKNQEIERVAIENKRIQKMYDDLITKDTKVKQSTLTTKRKNMSDWYFGAEEALELGVCHEIITTLE